MGYQNLRDCLRDLKRTGQLVEIDEEIDPRLEAAAIHLRVHRAGGPADPVQTFARVPLPRDQ